MAPSVLIVDDDQSMRDFLSMLVELGGFTLVGAAVDGLEAVSISEETQPDIVILDLEMPRMSGLEALPRIHEVSPHSKVVVFSAYDASKALEHGAADYLEKDVPPAELTRRLHELHAAG